MKDLEADVQLLLECLRYQEDEPSAVKQALITIAAICTNHDDGQHILRKKGGLNHVVHILKSTSYIEVKQAALFCLGSVADKNVFCQKELCTMGMFSSLHSLLVTHSENVKLLRTAVFLIISLVANNGLGQMLVNRSKCLEVILRLFRINMPGFDEDASFGNDDDGNHQLWSAITSALSVCVNNPQNDENQRVCCEVFPIIFKCLNDNTAPGVLKPLASFVGLAVANNVHNQDRVLQCGGLRVLHSALYRASNHIQDDADNVKICVSLTTTIDSIITDNVPGREECSRLGLVPILLRLIKSSSVDNHVRTQILLTLGHCTDSCVNNQAQVVNTGGLKYLIKLMTEDQDEELTSATKYVLRSCMKTGGPADGILNTSQQNREKRSSDASEKKISDEDIFRKLESLENQLSEVMQPSPSFNNSVQVSPRSQCHSISVGYPGMMRRGQSLTSLPQTSPAARRCSTPAPSQQTPGYPDINRIQTEGNQYQNMHISHPAYAPYQLNSSFSGHNPHAQKSLLIARAASTSGSMTREVSQRSDLPQDRNMTGRQVPEAHYLLNDKNPMERDNTRQEMCSNYHRFQPDQSSAHYHNPLKVSVDNTPTGNGNIPATFYDPVTPQAFPQHLLHPMYAGPAYQQSMPNLAFGTTHPHMRHYQSLPDQRRYLNNCMDSGSSRNTPVTICTENTEMSDVQAGSMERLNDPSEIPTSNQEKIKSSKNLPSEEEKIDIFMGRTILDEAGISSSPPRNNRSAPDVRSMSAVSPREDISANSRSDNTYHATSQNNKEQSQEMLVLKKRLDKERQMCIALKKEAKEAREELSKRREQEHEAARRSAELVSEIERQQTETPDARLRKQLSANQQQHQQLLEQVKEKEQHMNILKKQLSLYMSSPLSSTSDSVSPVSITTPGNISDDCSSVKSTRHHKPSVRSALTSPNNTVESNNSDFVTHRTSSVKSIHRNLKDIPTDTSKKNKHFRIARNIGTKLMSLQKKRTGDDKFTSDRKNEIDVTLNKNKVKKDNRYTINKKNEFDEDGFLLPHTPVLTRKSHKHDKTRSSKTQPSKHTINSFTGITPSKATVESPKYQPVVVLEPLQIQKKISSAQSRYLTSPPPSPSPSVASEFDVGLLRAARRSTESHDLRRATTSPCLSTPRNSPEKIPLAQRILRSSSHSLQNLKQMITRRHYSTDTPQSSPQSRHKKAHKDASFTQFFDLTGSSMSDSDTSGNSFFSEDEQNKENTMLEIRSVPINSSKSKNNNKCPGCQPPDRLDGLLLNSRTYNIALETSTETCRLHRMMRKQERLYISQKQAEQEKTCRPLLKCHSLQRKIKDFDEKAKIKEENMESDIDVYRFSSEGTPAQSNVSPALRKSTGSDTVRSPYLTRGARRGRRQRVEYTEEEVNWLKAGVQRFGRVWNQILNEYPFHHTRIAVDLKDKYKRLTRKKKAEKISPTSKETKHPRHFSMVEERRLRRGVRVLGYNWQAILDMYTFSKGRTALQLRNKWKTLHKY